MLWVLIKVPHQGASNEYYNIHFCGEIRKISIPFDLKNVLPGAMFAIEHFY